MRNEKLDEQRIKMGTRRVGKRLRLLTAAFLIFHFSFFIYSCNNPFLPEKPDKKGVDQIYYIGFITNGRDTPAPVITIITQPQAETNVTAGSISGSLTIEASVTEGVKPSVRALSYQWYSSASNQHEHGSVIQGATGTIFAIPVDLVPGYHYYFCEVSATGAVSVRSDAALVAVAPDPALLILNGEIIITVNGSPVIDETETGIELTAYYNGIESVGYQWNKDGQHIDSETNQTFTPGEAGEYTVTVNAVGYNSKTSDPVTVVTPTPIITITAHPEDTTVTAGSISGSLTVVAEVTENAMLSYQWYSSATDQHEHGSAIQGATDAIFAIPVDLDPGSHYFFCEVSAAGGAVSVRSDVALVTVEDDPSLKHLSGTISITVNGNPVTGEVIVDTELTASYSGSESVTWQWNKDGLHINNAAGLTYTPSAAGDYTVTVHADGYNPLTSGPVTVYETGDSDINISIDLGPSLIGNIIDTAVQQGENVVISTTGSFDAYAWRLNGETIPNENESTLTLPLAQCVGKTVYITANIKLGAYWYNQNMSLTITRN